MYVSMYARMGIYGQERKEHMTKEERKMIRMHGELVLLEIGFGEREGEGEGEAEGGRRLVDDTFSILFIPSTKVNSSSNANIKSQKTY